MKVHDILRHGDQFYEIGGIYLGALGQESVVGVTTIGKTAPDGHGGRRLDYSYIPISIAESMQRYESSARGTITIQMTKG